MSQEMIEIIGLNLSENFINEKEKESR